MPSKTAQSPVRSNEPVEYPTQICLSTEKGKFFLNRDGKRYKIPSHEVYKSWRFPLTIETTEAACANYPIAFTKLKFRDGSLLYNIADAKMYIVSDGKLRHITTPHALQNLAVTFDDFMTVSDDDINSMTKGEPIK